MIVATRRTIKWEKKFLARSRSAFAAAHKRSRASGLTVVISVRGAIYKILPNGKRDLLKVLEKPTAVRRGMKVRIR